MSNTVIPTDFPYESKFVDVYGSKMHYIEQGSGRPILFLHGVPTSCYVWRNIIPHLSTLGRCIAVDLIGMGKSEKPDIEYTIEDHIKYITQFIETMNLKNVTLVLHGWGSIIGFEYAMQHEKNCRALAFYEAYLRPFQNEDISLPLQEQLYSFDQEENTYELIMTGTYFIDKVLPQELMRPLNEKELSSYREPFVHEGSGKPLTQYLKELPRGDTENKVDKIIDGYSRKLMKSSLPKLMMYSVPGFITSIATIMWAKDHFKNLEIIDIGEELHFAQESNPVLMGETLSVWMQSIET